MEVVGHSMYIRVEMGQNDIDFQKTSVYNTEKTQKIKEK